LLQTRIIPCLQLIGESLVKTVKFGNHQYIGDPLNTVRIFNELEVDELCFQDIRATKENRHPPIELLKQIANEAFMPMAYGGGIKTFEQAKEILSIGFEKIIINTAAVKTPHLISQIADHFGAQAMVGSIDVKKNLLGQYQVYITDGTEKTSKDPVIWAKELEHLGVGELLLTSMDRDGTWAGFDIPITEKITQSVGIPVIANGGAGNITHIDEVLNKAHASAVALGSMVVYQKKGMGVLVNFPDKKKLERII
jgi:cyclase